MMLVKQSVTIFLVFILAVSFSGCARETEEVKVKKVVTAIQAAAEEKDIKKIMTHVSKNYSDPYGYDHEEIRGLLLGYFFRYPKISAYITGLTISVDGASAKAVFQVVLTSSDKTGSIKDVIPQELGVWDFNVTLEKESGDWKVASAQWEEAQVALPME